MKDIEALQTITKKNTDTSMRLTIIDGGVTRRTEGLQSTAQRFIQLLLTPLSAVPMDPLRGTELVAQMHSGVLTQQEYTEHYLLVALASAKDQLNADTVSPDERIDTVSLLAFKANQGILNIKIKLITDSGDEVLYTFPTR